MNYKKIEYKEEEKKYRNFLIKRIEDAKTQRDNPWTELDDMNYLTYWENNNKTGNSYNPPKKNSNDVRLTSGVVLEKENSLVTSLLNLNLKSNIEVYDKNDLPIYRLGELMEDMIEKAKQVDLYEKKKIGIYREAVRQGTWYVNVMNEDVYCLDKEMNDFDNSVITQDIKWKEKRYKKESKITINLVDGRKVYLGNFKQNNIDEQPYIAIVDILSIAEAESIYGKWDRWENVPKDKVEKSIISDTDGNSDYGDWTLLESLDGFIERIIYQDAFNNEVQILLNGVEMLPSKFPLKESGISPSGKYTIAKGDLEIISEFFALSKSTSAKTGVDQATFDEMVRYMILKTRQSFSPPYINNTGRVLSRDIFLPGKVTSNIGTDELKPLIEAKGVTTPEFNAMTFLKKIIDDKSISPVFQGQSLQGRQTATEIIELKKQTMMKIGLAIYGIVNFEMRLNELVRDNILFHWTKLQDTRLDEVKNNLEELYQTNTMTGVLENGQDGKKIIEFTTDKEKLNRTSEQILKEEEILSKDIYHEPVRKVYMNPKILRTLPYRWYMTIVPSEKNSSELDRILFVQDITQGINLFGREAFNQGYLKEQWAIRTKMDPNKLFIKEQPIPLNAGFMPQGQGNVPTQITQGIKQPIQQPSINTIMQK